MYKCVSDLYQDETLLHCVEYKGNAECEFMKMPSSKNREVSSISTTTTTPVTTTPMPTQEEMFTTRTTVSTLLPNSDILKCSQNSSQNDHPIWPYIVIITMSIIIIAILLILCRCYYTSNQRLLNAIKSENGGLMNAFTDLKKTTENMKSDMTSEITKMNAKLVLLSGSKESDGYV